VLSDYRLALITGLVAVVVLSLLIYLWRRRGGRSSDPLRAVSVKSLQDILLPDRMGGLIHLQHVLLTAKGFVVLDLKTVSGTVFGGDMLDEWTVIGNAQRFTFPNPQRALYDRIAALKTIVRDMPVTGHILFFDDAEFSKGRPSDVIFPGELQERYRKPDSAELERLMEAFQPHWERVLEASEPAPRSSRPV
jgi:hypothetical protein